jgi:hypothetical protein
MIDYYDSGTPIDKPMWDTWVVNNAHFFSANSGLWGFYRNDCAGIAGGDRCRDINYTDQGACTSDGNQDGYGDNCAQDGTEVCEDYSGWATDMMTAFQAFTANYNAAKAAGTANAIFGGSHYPWTRWDDIMAETGDSSSFYHPYIDQMEVALKDSGTTDDRPFIWLNGHWHQNACCGLCNDPDYPSCDVDGDGTTVRHGVKWVTWMSSGTSAASAYPNDFLAGTYWEVDETGLARFKFVNANGQGGGI